MKPRKPPPEQDDLLRARLVEMLGMRHELVKLADLIDWEVFEREWAGHFPSSVGRPATQTRLVAGLFYLQQISVKSQFSVEGGDFLISKRQIVHGACAVVPDEFAGAIVSNEYAVLRCRGGFDLGYLKHLSHSVYFQQTCFHSCIGVHIEKMIFKVEEWLEREFDLPPIEKQREIAGSVDAVDRKIALLRDKRAALELFKVSTMDRIFRQEVRFSREDGSEFPEWRPETLGAITKWTSGGTPSKANEALWSGDIPWISASSMHSEVITDAPTRVSPAAIGRGTRIAPTGSLLLLVRGTAGSVKSAAPRASGQ